MYATWISLDFDPNFRKFYQHYVLLAYSHGIHILPYSLTFGVKKPPAVLHEVLLPTYLT